MNWIILIIAGLFESGFAFCLGKMKGLHGTGYYLWGCGFLVCLTLSMLLLTKATQTLPISTAYPVWTGIGAVGTVILGILFFHEPVSFARIFFHYDADCLYRRVKNGLTPCNCMQHIYLCADANCSFIDLPLSLDKKQILFSDSKISPITGNKGNKTEPSTSGLTTHPGYPPLLHSGPILSSTHSS